MRTPLNDHLFALLDELSAELPDVTHRYMFGCDALFANGKIYALVYAPERRIAVKISDPAQQQELCALDGTDPWTPGQRMGNWWLVPESFHDDAEQLRRWVERAHRAAFEESARVAAKSRPAARAGPGKGGDATGARRPRGAGAKGRAAVKTAGESRSARRPSAKKSVTRSGKGRSKR